MSINFCTLANTSVDNFCGNRRSLVVGHLLDQKYSGKNAAGGNPRVLRDTFVPPHEEIERPILTFEQPWITVSVEFDGKTGVQTLDATPQIEFVSITELKFNTLDHILISDLTFGGATISVNISDFQVTSI